MHANVGSFLIFQEIIAISLFRKNIFDIFNIIRISNSKILKAHFWSPVEGDLVVAAGVVPLLVRGFDSAVRDEVRLALLNELKIIIFIPVFLFEFRKIEKKCLGRNFSFKIFVINWFSNTSVFLQICQNFSRYAFCTWICVEALSASASKPVILILSPFLSAISKLKIRRSLPALLLIARSSSLEKL